MINNSFVLKSNFKTSQIRKFSVSQKNYQRPITLEVMKRLPKAELHCHLDGSLKVQTIIELAKEQGVELPSYDVDELTALVTVDENCTSLVQYLRGFDITLKVLQKSYSISRAVYEMAKDAHEDGVRYIEIRFSPILHVAEGLSLSSVMEAVCEGQTLAQYNLPIIVQIIVCGMRQMDPSQTVLLAEIAWRYKHKGVCGFDLAGPEYGFSSKFHADAISIVRRKFVNITLHSGEAFGWESVRDSLQFCGSHRLGHGTRMRENGKLVEYAADVGVVVEVCLTSNLQTKSINSIEEHPIREYFDKGIVVVPCTDNTVVSGITLSGEYFLAQKHFNFTVEEIVRMIDFGFRGAFLETSTKNRIRAEAFHKCLSILRREGYDISSVVKNSSYFDWIGVNIEEVMNPAKNYWKNWTNPIITKDLCRALPKVDLNCHFDRTISAEFLYEELLQNPKAMQHTKDLLPFESKEDFLSQVREASRHDSIWWKIIHYTITTKDQIERVINELYEKAVSHNIRYLELLINPKNYSHTNGLETEQVLQVVLLHTKEMNIKYKDRIYMGVVIVSSFPNTIIDTYNMANLAVKYANQGVLGFSLKPHSVGLFLEDYYTTIALLKEHNIKTIIYASTIKNISFALSDCGANRISGACDIHQSPEIMSYLSNHDIVLDISVDQMYSEFQDLFPITLLLESYVPFNLGSYLRKIDGHWTGDLYSVVKTCRLTIDKVLLMIFNGFRANFLPLQLRQQLFIKAKEEAEEILTKHEHKFLYKEHYFPPKSTHGE